MEAFHSYPSPQDGWRQELIMMLMMYTPLTGQVEKAEVVDPANNLGFSRSVIPSVSQSVSQRVSQANQKVNQIINQPVNQPIGQSVNQSIRE